MTGKVRVSVHREVFAELFATGAKVCVARGLPPGARMVGWSYDPLKDRFDLVFEHPDLPDVSEGYAVPAMDIWFCDSNRLESENPVEKRE